jgi:hypothetical protein
MEDDVTPLTLAEMIKPVKVLMKPANILHKAAFISDEQFAISDTPRFPMGARLECADGRSYIYVCIDCNKFTGVAGATDLTVNRGTDLALFDNGHEFDPPLPVTSTIERRVFALNYNGTSGALDTIIGTTLGVTSYSAVIGAKTFGKDFTILSKARGQAQSYIYLFVREIYSSIGKMTYIDTEKMSSKK